MSDPGEELLMRSVFKDIVWKVVLKRSAGIRSGEQEEGFILDYVKEEEGWPVCFLLKV